MNCVEGICFFENKKNIPTEVDNYRYRNVFTTQEGKYVGILLHASSISESRLKDLWKQRHRVVVKADDKEFEQVDNFKCHSLIEDEQYLVVGCIDWTEVFQQTYTNIEITVTMGYREIVFVSKKLITVLPKRMSNNELCPLDMYLTAQGSINLEDDVEDEDCQYGFDQDENREAHVWLVCRNNFCDYVNDNLLAEVEFKVFHETLGLVDRSLVYGVDITYNKVLFRGDFSIGNWPEGGYKIKAFLWGTQIAESVCVIGRSLYGKYPFTDLITPKKPSIIKKEKPVVGSLNAIEKINSMIGLECVKKNILQNLNYNKFITARKIANLRVDNRLIHICMTGNPGTGKTTVARLLAEAYAQIGIVSNDNFIEANRASLIGQYIGETEKNVKEMLRLARGGCLFIDEAYSLITDSRDSRDYGKKVIDTLMTELSDPSNDTLIIIAGYEKEMNRFLQTNPGLQSRFPVRLHFPDYTVAELLDMVSAYFADHQYQATEMVMARIEHILRQVCKRKDFGNGRFIHVLIENHILPRMATRLAQKLNAGDFEIQDLQTIIPEDVPDQEEVIPMLGQPQQQERRAIGFR